ncbi:MAG TPA: fimbrial assembly protein FimA, partial [Opitutae bacterium]|nr:fimbrial assembly protein FimA [Opitutae bacterium]
IIGTDGNASVFTGSECMDWAGGKTGKNYAVQGNILTGSKVIEAMGEAFEDNNGTLAERMIASLHAGQKAGGDKRGRQSAALLVVRQGWGYGGLTDRFRDLRVDDHPTPIKELERIYYIHRKIFPRPNQNLESKNVLK